MPEVKLISYTGHGHPDRLYAARLLAYTKNTRLQMTPDGFDAFSMHNKGETDILKELEYMAGTIPSSWEFVDVIFAVNKVSRATAQQITRTRTASFAMQSQRVTDMSDVSWDKKPVEIDRLYGIDVTFDSAMNGGIENYTAAVKSGMTLEDARDLLPIGVHCNLIAKYNFRAFVELVRARESLRVQGPYVEMVKQMKEQVLEVWPWAATFFEPKDAKSIKMIEDVARELSALEGEKGAMYKGLSGRLAKAADLLKK